MNDNWKSGIDGGDWIYCPTCKVSTPLNERGICATCGSVLTCGPDCRCAPCLRQQDRFWFAFEAAARHHVAGWWIACQRQQGHFPAHLIAEAERRYARGQSERIPA